MGGVDENGIVDELTIEIEDHGDLADGLGGYATRPEPRRSDERTFRGKQSSRRARQCDGSALLPHTRRRLVHFTLVGALVLIGVMTYVNLGPRRDTMMQAFTRLAWTAQAAESPLKNDLDPDNLFYTRKQCRQHFPNLYQEVERSALYHQRHGGISKRDVDKTSSIYEGREGMIQFQIIKNQVSRLISEAHTRAHASSPSSTLPNSTESIDFGQGSRQHYTRSTGQ